MPQELLGNRFLALFALGLIALFQRPNQRHRDLSLESITIVIWAVILVRLLPRFVFDLSLPGGTVLLLNSSAPFWMGLALAFVYGFLPDILPLLPFLFLAGIIVDPGFMQTPLVSGGIMRFSEQEGWLNVLLLLGPTLLFLYRNRHGAPLFSMVTLSLFWGVIPALLVTKVVCTKRQNFLFYLKEKLAGVILFAVASYWFESAGYDRSFIALAGAVLLGGFLEMLFRCSPEKGATCP